MLSFLMPLAYKVVDSAVAKIPEDAELGEKLIEICRPLADFKLSNKPTFHTSNGASIPSWGTPGARIQTCDF